MSDPKPPHLAQVSPVFAVADLAAAIAYYRDKLLFRSRFEWTDDGGEPPRYSIMLRDAVELHLSSSAQRGPAMAYCFVDRIDAYYPQVREAGATITEALTDQPWDMREFAVTDLDGNTLVFGEHLTRISG